MKELTTIEKLANSFSNFQSVGAKTAERMAFNVLNMPQSQIDDLIKNLKDVKEKIHQCPICGLLTEDEVCSICSSKERNHSTCIVLSNYKDVYSFEKLNSYDGIYHVLGGDISSLKGITPNDLKIKELIERIDKENIQELIIATNPTIEGETTALYLARILANKQIKITRLAYGLSIGSSFDYTDELTIQKALDGRTNLK